MDLYYISHPYTSNGDIQDNIKKAKEIKRILQHIYPNIVFISPLDEFGEYFDLPYETVLAYCFKLLSKCDHIIMCGDWEHSKGCIAELAYAKHKGIEVSYFAGYAMAEDRVKESEYEDE